MARLAHRLKRVPVAALFLGVSLGLAACAHSPGQLPPTRWTTGFWLWHGSSAAVPWSGQPLDALFVHVGAIRKLTSTPGEPWNAYGELPNRLPPAREYWLVFRFERQGVPDLPAAPVLAREVRHLLDAARTRHLNVAGVQLDIDSPTGALSQYARFIREVRKGLPPGCEISITALLDWFRKGTAIAGVIEEVDEFVPQFYDVSKFDSDEAGTAIAAKIDPERWGPVFNRFGKRFRIGISTFGRARPIPNEDSSQPAYRQAVFFADLSQMDFASSSAFRLDVAQNVAGELVLSYRATRKTRIGDNDFDPGDAMQFILSTPGAVRAAVESARRIGGRLAGVVFFRWPGTNETLAMRPDEALAAAGPILNRWPAEFRP